METEGSGWFDPDRSMSEKKRPQPPTRRTSRIGEHCPHGLWVEITGI